MIVVIVAYAKFYGWFNFSLELDLLILCLLLTLLNVYLACDLA